MEKILDHRESKHTPAEKVYRFQCACITPSDALDVDIMETGPIPDSKFIIFSMHFKDPSFWNRVRFAFQILRGWWNWREFVVRSEDMKNLSELVNPDKKFSELP